MKPTPTAIIPISAAMIAIIVATLSALKSVCKDSASSTKGAIVSDTLKIPNANRLLNVMAKKTNKKHDG